ncbi:hypothetical protein DXC37_09005 [Bifidobacterium bifidum]|uniref:Uncharacterized protein n=2 Tax=Bifidobacterium bifidum TaxID=1681 RepID=A0A415C396_BIFBI|nr:hypothetical protein DXD34_09820 [Bifidobacterium bifidum]RGL95105.1 hypothetical protein DXC37_09005 [Bifidobacterium bifidum]RHA93735.1 hypothetical protein DW909_08330 [Bifidobacterium bifidum]RHJ03255.1 hypothetical protein DW145_09340 [Bifidobacterium bifidum]RHJ22119.1 hypothetical protein DW137_09895 [Bifidobacterium bifidum]
MDDITMVSSTEEIEKRNTYMITKNTEARSRTVFAVLGGAIAGLVVCLVVGPFVGYTIGAVFILVGAGVSPFLLVGRMRDRTQQVRWKRLLQKLQSRNIEGEVFYPNSTHPENITDLEEMRIL